MRRRIRKGPTFLMEAGNGTSPGGLVTVSIRRRAREAVQHWVEESCAEQGLVVKVTDAEAIRKVTVLLGTENGSPRSESDDSGQPGADS